MATTTRRRDIVELVDNLDVAEVGTLGGDAALLLMMSHEYCTGAHAPNVDELRVLTSELTWFVQVSGQTPAGASLLASLVLAAHAIQATMAGDDALADVLVTRGNYHLRNARLLAS